MTEDVPGRERRVRIDHAVTIEIDRMLSIAMACASLVLLRAGWLGHVRTADHNRVNCSARTVLNVNRDSMADVGFSPPTRIFEAADRVERIGHRPGA